MKKLILILLITSFCYSQDRVSFGVFQDAKLLLGQDKKYGNDKPTLDGVFYFELEGKQLNDYYFSVQNFYQIAELSGGTLQRYGVNGMWNFNQFNKTTASIGLGVSCLNRFGYSLGSYQFVSELSYKIYKKIKISLRYEYVRRSDIELFRSNGSLGIKI